MRLLSLVYPDLRSYLRPVIAFISVAGLRFNDVGLIVQNGPLILLVLARIEDCSTQRAVLLPLEPRVHAFLVEDMVAVRLEYCGSDLKLDQADAASC